MSEFDSDLLEARISDLIFRTEKTYCSNFAGFFDEGGISKSQRVIERSGTDCFTYFWGGFEDSERKMLGVFASEADLDCGEFPLTALTFRYKKDYKLTHRDFLGALMSLGLKRDAIGDILIDEGRCVVFVRSEIADYVKDQIETVGRVGVRITDGTDGDLPKNVTFEEISGTIASERLDCIVAALVGKSREKAVAMIKSGAVKVSGIECMNVSQRVSENKIISVKGYGKFVVDRLGPKTKKGRLSFKGRKYK